jgi:hypothetical protein
MKKKNKELEYVKKGGRVFANMNTGTRIHKPNKGKGSYKRIKKIKECSDHGMD